MIPSSSGVTEHANAGYRYADAVPPANNCSSGMLGAKTTPGSEHGRAAECDVSRLADVTEQRHITPQEATQEAIQEATPGNMPCGRA